MAVIIGSIALLFGAGVQLMFVVVLLLGGVEQRFIPTLALAGGLATIGMLSSIRAWMGRDWGIDVLVAFLELLVSPWLFGLDAVGLGLIVAFSGALVGLVNGRAWFRPPDDRDT